MIRPRLAAAVLASFLAGPARASLDVSFFDALRVVPSARPAVPAAPRPPEPSRIASGLDFGGVTWPAELTDADKAALMTALNISGSFEGGEGWGNISDDFDGQGLSLGLLNQCLGQGSLQPLLIRLRDRQPAKLAALVSPAHLESLLAMLKRWQEASAKEGPAPFRSLLDAGPSDESGPDLTPANSESVAWARANLYAAKAFDPVWKAELIAVAQSPEYVSEQIAAALGLHRDALADETRSGVRDLRTYLFLFDVQVQNGGIGQDDWADYAAYRRKTPRATDEAKLKKLLELRLRHVRSKYVGDVRSRKTAIIVGRGKVHGEFRNLPVEYAYDPAWPYR